MSENIETKPCRPGLCTGDITDPRLKLIALKKRHAHLHTEKDLIDDKIYLIEHEISMISMGIKENPCTGGATVTQRDPVLDCRQEVKDFAVLMEQKLRKNDHKTSWKRCNQEYLLQRLDDEVKELHKCFFIYSPGDMNFLMDGQHEDKIPGEAADVANFAMMLWDNFGEKQGSLK